MAALDESHAFVVPKKEIFGPEDMDKWTKSDAYQEYLGFLESLNEAVRGKSLTHPVTPSPVVDGIIQLLDNVDKIIEQTPLIDQPQRFGNKAFATFYHKLSETMDDLLRGALPEKYHKAIPEIAIYVVESVGNSTRIDYGSGHELSFVMFIYCLFRIGLLDCNSKDDKIAAVTKIFNRYLDLVRKLQLKYTMEPAGSHGVWSLDDFQFVPFIWGSSQLVANPKVEPSNFTDEITVQRLASEYMFLGCIQYILQVKSGPFHEHSNQLWNISGTSSWTKINQGMIKMYKGEVLAKFPVVQHMLFGSLLSITPFDSTKKLFQGRPLPSLGRSLNSAPAPPTFKADSNLNPDPASNNQPQPTPNN